MNPTDQPELSGTVLDLDSPHSARMYDYYLGGRTNFRADRAAADQVIKRYPHVRTTAVENRAFMRRAVRFLAEQGFDQFLDIGTGIPTSPNLHEVVHRVNPDARVLYVDNDPMVLTHARALMDDTSARRTRYLPADLREPHTVLGSAELADTLDLNRPVALSLLAILHFVRDEDAPLDLVRAYLGALAPGSALVISHVTAFYAPAWHELEAIYNTAGVDAQVRDPEEIALFLDGLELVDPGLVLVDQWRPDPGSKQLRPEQVSCYGAVGYLNQHTT